MKRLTPDPSFYPTAAKAAAAAPEELAYVATIGVGENGNARPDALAVLDLEPGSPTYGRIVNRVEMPNVGDELHHFGWNACSSALCPWMPHPHVERRYLIVPGLRSSRIYVLDAGDDARSPRIVKTIEPEEIARKTGYSRAHTVHCGPDGIYVNALGNPDGDGPGGIFVLDHDTFRIKGAWERDRGSQQLAYDFWWHLGYDRVITSEWGTPNMVEDGVNPDLLLGNQYGHKLHVFDMKGRRHLQEIDLGAEDGDPAPRHRRAARRLPRAQPRDGWLFAVGLGMQDKNRRGVLRALPPIAAGHQLAIAAVAALVVGVGTLADPRPLHLGAAGALIGFGVFRFLRPRAHARWTTMRVSRKELTWWSFLMSSTHGAGLMVVPILLGAGAVDARTRRPATGTTRSRRPSASATPPSCSRCTWGRCSRSWRWSPSSSTRSWDWPSCAGPG